MLAAAVSSAVAQPRAELPFAPGEQLTYRVQAGRFGAVGDGVMSVEGPVMLRDVSVYVLRFDVRARVVLLTASDHSESWIDPERLVSLRYHKRERHPFSRFDERVEVYPDARRWRRNGGEQDTSATDAPLDELSFIYFVRTLPLEPGTTLEFNRHFEPDRNPIRVSVLRRETIETPAGEFDVVLVELRVKDPRRYGGEGVIRMHLSDDARRLPVRIASDLPSSGSTLLTLTGYARPADSAR
jgi:hypothetical protein